MRKLLFISILLIFSISNAQNYIVETSGTLTFPVDGNGDSVPDFSHAGYKNSDESLPAFGVEYTTEVTLSSPSGDETTRIQNAINTVEALTPNGSGYRGAVVLGAGTWNFSSELTIEASGVVIRGAGIDSTFLQYTGSYVNTGITIGGPSASAAPETLFDTGTSGTHWDITDAIVEVGSLEFDVEAGHTLEIGDRIIVEHPSTAAWVASVDGGGVVTAPDWTANQVDIRYYRYVTNVNVNTITIDAPIFYTFIKAISQCYVFEYTQAVTEDIGIENLTVDMDLGTDSLLDKSFYAFRQFYTENCWFRNVRTRNFRVSGFGMVESSRITYENCEALDPHSKIIYSRRYNFGMEGGQLVLYKDCYGRHARHSFIGNGWAMDSGNVVLRGISEDVYGPSEIGHQRWASGNLFDGTIFRNVGDPELGEFGSYLHTDMFWLGNHHDNGGGHGWASVSCVAYKCIIEGNGNGVVQKPPTGMNYEIDCVGEWRDYKGGISAPGALNISTSGIMPASLFETQLAQRTGGGGGPDWSVDYTLVDYGTVLNGGNSDIVVTYLNTSGGALSGTVVEDSAHYSIIAGSTFSSIADTATHEVTVRYSPTTDAQHAATLTLNDGVADFDIPLTGIAATLQADLGPFNADLGTLIAPIVDGGTYIVTPDRDLGFAVYAFTIPTTGTYRILVSVDAPNIGSNSFNLNIDSTPVAGIDIWDIVSLTTGAEARVVTGRGNGDWDFQEFDPLIFSLTAGTHFLILGGREQDTLLYTIEIDSLGVAPTSARGVGNSSGLPFAK